MNIIYTAIGTHMCSADTCLVHLIANVIKRSWYYKFKFYIRIPSNIGFQISYGYFPFEDDQPQPSDGQLLPLNYYSLFAVPH